LEISRKKNGFLDTSLGKDLIMTEDIEKSVLSVSKISIATALKTFLDEELPFEITEEMVQKVANYFVWKIEDVTPESEKFWELYFDIFYNAVYDALYDKARNEKK